MGLLGCYNEDSKNHIVSRINKSGNIFHLPHIWSLDYGASDHVCHHLYSFKTICKIKPISVCFPNGNILPTHYSGTIQFSN